MRIDELEIKPTYLYHAMTLGKTEELVDTNGFRGMWEHDIPGIGKRRGNSFSRRKDFWFTNDHCVRITVDRQKLSQRNRIIPLDGELVFAHTQKHRYHEKDRSRKEAQYELREEFVIGDIKNIAPMIIKVEARLSAHLSGLYNTISNLRMWCNHRNIPFSMTEQLMKHFREIEELWAEDDED